MTDRPRIESPGVCCRVCRRVSSGRRLLSGVPEAAGPPELLVEAPDPGEGGAGPQGGEEGGVGRERGPGGPRRRRSGGSDRESERPTLVSNIFIPEFLEIERTR